MCLLCELGFLFDMLDKAEGEACQASNFIKTLSYHPDCKFEFPVRIAVGIILTLSSRAVRFVRGRTARESSHSRITATGTVSTAANVTELQYYCS